MKSYSPDNASIVSAKFLRQNPKRGRQVVILGAGASKQAFPNGDKNGRKLPVMNELAEFVGLEQELNGLGVSSSVDNFEEIYSSLFNNPKNSDRLAEIEAKIRRYFAQMELPDQPTLFDLLLLSLREQDLVATFNWDPLLFDAWWRLGLRFGQNRLPSIVYLHGNVRVGYCPEHMMYGPNGLPCDKCNKFLRPTPLLFPIEEKGYNTDPFIRNAWEKLSAELEAAFTVTIFGYSAPSSDIAARNAMLRAWKATSNREFEMMFFIDINTYDKLYASWRPFFFDSSPHFRIYKDFYESPIARYARRSVEGVYVPTVEGKLAKPLPIPRNATWDELDTWLSGMTKYE